MQPDEFETYRSVLLAESGLTITPEKAYLLDSRLLPIAKAHGFTSLSELSKILIGPGRKETVVKEVVEAMTTNETSFFRDTHPFEVFEKVVMDYILKKKTTNRTIRIWSAAASSGQEPYTLAIVLKEMADKLVGWNVEIMATDISDYILDKAKTGIYSQFEVQRGLPTKLMLRYFEQNNDTWRIRDEIRQMVKFSNFNLLKDMAPLGTFDIVFCRNVLIYFNDEKKRDVLTRISQRLTPEGFLFLGGAETVLGITDIFEPAKGQRGLYILKGGTYKFEDSALSTATN